MTRLALILSLLAAPLLAGDWDTAAMMTLDKWKGCKPGSMIHTRVTTEISGQRTVQEIRETLKEVTRTHYVVVVEQAEQGKKGVSKSERREPRPVVEVELNSRAEGKYKFPDGTEVDCIIKELKRTAGDSTEVIKTWEHARHGVLAMEMSSGKIKMRTQVVKLGLEHAVNGTTVTCRVLETYGNGRLLGRHVMSAEVPNRVVMREFRNGQGAERVDLLAFVRK